MLPLLTFEPGNLRPGNANSGISVNAEWIPCESHLNSVNYDNVIVKDSWAQNGAFISPSYWTDKFSFTALLEFFPILLLPQKQTEKSAPWERDVIREGCLVPGRS